MPDVVFVADTLTRALAVEMLPKDLRLYECGGQIIFPIYAVSNGVSALHMGYLIRPGKGKPTSHDLGRHEAMDLGNGWLSCGFEVVLGEGESGIRASIQDAIDKLRDKAAA